MKKYFTLIFALMAAISVNADELYLVGDGTPIGWEGDGNMRQTTRMTETSEGVYVWTGLLKHGGEGFKIVNSFGGWDGYHPSSENFAIGESGVDTYTTSGNDWKWNPTSENWQYYTITLNKNEGTLSWALASPTLLEPVDGVISIGTAEELNTLAFMTRNNVNNESYNVKLTADIDYTAYKNGSMSAIGVTEKFPFRGEFDGGNYTVTVDLESYSTRFSLFGTIQGKVHNLKVAGKITATNRNQIGGICGLLKTDGSKIYNCISAAEIIDSQSGDGTIGGICAVTYDATSIENCAFYGKVSASGRDGNGGILSWANSGASTTVKNCLVVADINWAGGVDFGRNNPSVINTYKTGQNDAQLANGQMTYKLNNYVSGGEDWFQTLDTDAMPSPLSSSAILYANGSFYCDGVTPKEGVEIVLSNENASIVDEHVFGENGICTGCNAAGLEPEAVEGVFQLNNAGNLLWWAKYVNSGNPGSDAVLTADVDLSAAKYVPAGNVENVYVGTFDGQGHAVTLALNNSGLNYQGLFGVATDGATIKNVVVKGSVAGNSYVAGIVGGSNGSVDGKTLNIINCGNEATITAANANGAGIIGVNMGGAAHFYILNCYNVGNVTSGRESGAITGWTGGDKSTIENTYNIGVVTNGDGDGFVRGGGNLVNTYNLSADDAKVASGELCVNLGGTFGQTLGEDAYPNFTGKKVLAFGDTFANVESERSNGDAECILPSKRWGLDYSAYTFVAQGNFDYGDWNESNPNYNVIIGTPAEQDGKAWYAPGYSVEGWNYGQDLPEFGDGRPADVYAVRYFTVEGEIPGTLYMPAPHDDAPCEYYINGEQIWAETDGWNEWEVVRLTDEQKALIKTDGSVNVFAFHVHQNWGGRYADGGLYTAGQMVIDFNNDVQALEATIALAEAQGIDAEVIEFAKAKSNYRGGMGTGLAQLRKARRLAADARTENFTGTAPADGLIAYIFNVGAKMFLAGGNDWGTHASLNHMGAKCVLHANSSGANRYAIQTNLPNGRRGANDGLGHNGYVDCGYGDDFTTAEGWAWEFEPLADGTYHIINSQNSGSNIYLGMTDDERLQVDTDKAGAENAYNKWILVTPEEFEALAEQATEEAPVDLGHLIHQATFSQNDFDGNDKGAANDNLNDSKWERNAGGIWNWKGNSAGGDYMFEMWNTKDVGYVYLVQEVEGLPAGNYTVSMSGYYRDGNFESADEGNVRQLAYLFAGTEENCVPLAGIVEGSGDCPGYGRGGASGIVIPDGCHDAAKFFQVGTYTNTIDAVVGVDGKLRIGVFRNGGDDVKGGDWITTDNWRLYYKGNPVEVTVTDAGYATFVAPGNITTIPEGVEAFAAQAHPEWGLVHLEPVAAIPAGEAVVLKAAEGTYTVNASAFNAELGTENDLVAATEEVTADGTQYILAKQDEAVGFAQATPDTKIAAGKGYLVIAGAGVKAFYPFAEDATGISTIGNEQLTIGNEIYNLAGQRVSKAQKGVNIINGKKILK